MPRSLSRCFFIASACVAAGLMWGSLSSSAVAQPPGFGGPTGFPGQPGFGASAKEIPLPTAPEAWLNAPPLSLDNLKGKGVVLWFFEEDCPSCRQKWPGLLEVAESFKGKPVLFVGVNSGTPRAELERYLGEIKCTWPVIHDASRSFERACGVTEISLQNIMQCKIITPEGRLAQGDWSDIPATADKALTNAKWSVDQDKVPYALQDALTAVEFGMYPAAITKLKAAFKKADTKEGAQYLISHIKEKAKESSAEAEALVDAKDDWKAYKAILAVGEKFSGMPLTEKLAAAKKSLASSDAVRRQLKAREQFETAMKAAQVGTPVAMKKAKAIADKLVKDFGDTEAGEQAKQMMAGPTGPPSGSTPPGSTPPGSSPPR